MAQPAAASRVIYDMYAYPFDDEWQRRRSPFWELDRVDIPVLSIGAWGTNGPSSQP
jgi:hypothetical protein